MDRELFINNLHKVSKGELEYLDKKTFVKKLVDTDYPLNKDTNIKGLYNLIIGMEELSELQKEISKLIRNKGDKIAILEEMADVSVILEELKYICNIDDQLIEDAIQVKLNKASDNLKNSNLL